MADPQRFLDEMRRGRIINRTDLGYIIAPTAEIVGLADELAEEELLEEMVSYRKDVTGVDNTISSRQRGIPGTLRGCSNRYDGSSMPIGR
jgi:hypothetical protein